jgi:U3 small nucleolar RNA-associated protein 3
LNGLEADELDELLMDAQSSLATSKSAGVSSTDKPPKKKRKTDSDSKKPALPVFDLVEPEYNQSKTSSSNGATDSGELDAYGEATSLQHADQVDKNARKKSLRFHTSKIESASARRQGARSNAVGGDDDIPYKERRKEKDARVAKEAEKKTKSRGQGGDDLDGVEPENERGKRERDEVEGGDEDDSEDSADGYYELVKRKTKEKKAKKKGDYEEAQAAAKYVSSLRCIVLANSKITGRTSRMIQPPAHGLLPVQSCLIKASHPTGRKAFVTLELRRDRSSKRRKRRCRLRRLSIRVVLGIQEDMTVKSQAYRRWSRVFV